MDTLLEQAQSLLPSLKCLKDDLHRHPDTAEAMLQKIAESERERKAIAGVTKLARERAKKANLHNRKLRDCRVHLNDTKGELKEESSLFITEGDYRRRLGQREHHEKPRRGDTGRVQPARQTAQLFRADQESGL